MAATKIPDSSLLLANLVRVRQSSIRSINVEKDIQNSLIIEEYLPTGQSRSALSRILNRLLGPAPTRAWTLTGSYGSGKSYFALFLMNLICAAHPGHQHAIELLQNIDPVLCDQVISRFHVNSSNGYLAVPISGFRASFQECLRGGLRQALCPFSQDSSILNLLTNLERWDDQTDSRTIVDWFQKAQIVLPALSVPFQGILFVLDEMGKPLEYAASKPEKADVYLLQELAELANRSGDFPIVFIGILHQAFERYASLMNSAAQREWAKVQSRFEDIAFQEPPSQQIQLLARALESVYLDKFSSFLPIIKMTAEDADRNGWRPLLLSHEQFLELVIASYPFHPSSLTSLPFIFKRLAQNERSLFAFLVSSEPFGFQHFLQSCEAPGFLRLPHLFDYLTANFKARLYASGRARQLTETLERLSSAPNLEPLEMDLLKTIGLVNWLTESGGVQASETAIVSALRSEERSEDEIRLALRRLQDRSLIVFRRYNGTYNIWQGSDVDIEVCLDIARQKLTGTFSFAEVIQRYLPPRPLVARRNSYETGALRYFEVRYVDASTYLGAPLQPILGAAGLVLLALPTNQAEIKSFREWAIGSPVREHANVLVGIAEGSIHLAELGEELRALHWVSENTPELRDDPVARRELRARIAGIERLINNELDVNLKLHHLAEAKACEWYWQGQPVRFKERSTLSHILSNICDQIYIYSPILWNELINRRSLSSQAAAARRNLIEAMLTQQHLPMLGIEGYPPERSIYESLLKKSGLHALRNGNWRFTDPPHNDLLHIKPIWEAIFSFIFSPPVGPRPVDELFKRLEAPPYGLLAGAQPIFLCAFLLAHENETSLYREGSLLPEPSVADWEVLLRRPELFSVAGCRVTSSLQSILERFGRGFNVDPLVMPVVRSLVRRMRSLPSYAARTQRLPSEALRVRNVVETAYSPEQLLFHDLPIALDLPSFDEGQPDSATIQTFFDRLNFALEALALATPRLQDWARDCLLKACGLQTGDAGWELFTSLCIELVQRVNNPALLPLLKRVAEASYPQEAVESALAFVSARPLRSWSDQDIERFSGQAQAIGEMFIEERNGYLPSTLLDANQQARCRQIALRLKDVLCAEISDDPQTLRAALQLLSRELNLIGKDETRFTSYEMGKETE